MKDKHKQKSCKFSIYRTKIFRRYWKDANGTNQNIEGLNVKIVAISAGKELNNNEAVYEGQTVKYIITLTNNTGKDLNNLKIEADHENANVFDEEVYEEPDTFNTEQMKNLYTL